MIWSDGRVMPDDALRVSVLDRTFEHGLGLFETLRTWDGRAPLLGRHLDRLTRSARALSLPIDSVLLPDAAAVRELCVAAGPGDVLLRVTLTGGLGPNEGATLWVRTSPLPPPVRKGGASVLVFGGEPAPGLPLAGHKTLNYWRNRLFYERASAQGFDEAIAASEQGAGGRLFEGSRTNLFWVREGTLVTVRADSGRVLPGIFRGLVIERASALGVEVREVPWGTGHDLADAAEVFLTNSVRGIIPVGGLRFDALPGLGPKEFEAPGRVTRRLSLALTDHLQTAGDSV